MKILENEYIKIKDEKEDLEQLKEQACFGMLFGGILLFLGLLEYFRYGEFLSVFSLIEVVTGIILVLIGLIIPDVLFYPCKVFRFIGNKTGLLILKLLLLLVYICFVVPIGLIQRGKRKSYNFYSWENDKIDFPVSSFNTYKSTDIEGGNSKLINSVRYFFSLLLSGKHYYLIPVSIIIIVLGILFFYVSSSTVAYFVYTLF